MITVYDWEFEYIGRKIAVCTANPQKLDAWNELFRAVSGNLTSQTTQRKIRQLSTLIIGPVSRRVADNYLETLEEVGLQN